MLFFKHSFWALVILFFLGGCTHHYIPNPSTFKLDQINEFSSQNAISLINAQESSDDVLFLHFGAHKYFGNLQKWTDTAIAITKRELADREMNIVEDSPKSLKLSIETAKGTIGLYVARCETTLRAETGDGYVQTYKGDNRSPVTIYRAADGAVMRAVVEMLRDEKIIAYLKK